MVKLYSRPSCAPCQTLKYWFKKKGIEYKEYPATDDMLAPTLFINDEMIVGLQFKRIAELLT